MRRTSPCRARRGADKPEVLARQGACSSAIGCAGCHTPSHTTGIVEGQPQLSNQRIWPYTDLLLHDMGEGLADNRPEGVADGREWRTAPLWGIGLTQTVSGHTFFLHDGRARNVEEAILWHGGEAQAARDAYAALSKEEREALLAFVNSLCNLPLSRRGRGGLEPPDGGPLDLGVLEVAGDGHAGIRPRA